MVRVRSLFFPLLLALATPALSDKDTPTSPSCSPSHRDRLTPIRALNNKDCGDDDVALINEQVVSLEEAILHVEAGKCVASTEQEQVFVALNGENEGVWLNYKPGCAQKLGKVAAKTLGVRDDTLPLYMYTNMGVPLANQRFKQLEQLKCSGRILHVLLDGETWVWPGVKIGHTWQLEGATYKTLSLEPRVILVENAITHKQCDDFIKEAPEPVPSPEKHYSPGFENYRTSDSAFMGNRHKTANVMRARSARLARLPATDWCENLQLVRYTPGKWYKKHQDYFHNYRHVGRGPKPRVQPNRHATLFLYLNDDFEGGETVFPYAKDVPAPGIVREGMAECSEGLAVTPIKGAAALFYSRHGDGRLNPDSMHGGCPPVVGTKYGANAFMWNGPSAELYDTWSRIL